MSLWLVHSRDCVCVRANVRSMAVRVSEPWFVFAHDQGPGCVCAGVCGVYVTDRVLGHLYVYKCVRMFRCSRGSTRASVWTAGHM